jgi:hypothetical protein
VVDAVEDRDPTRARDLTERHVELRTRWSVDRHLRRVGSADADADAVDAEPRRQVAR